MTNSYILFFINYDADFKTETYENEAMLRNYIKQYCSEHTSQYNKVKQIYNLTDDIWDLSFKKACEMLIHTSTRVINYERDEYGVVEIVEGGRLLGKELGFEY